jgi:hypothetical protein
MVRSAMALPQLLAGAPSNATTWPLHRTKRGSLSRVAATFLPIGYELRLGLSHGRRAPIGHNSKLRIDVHGRAAGASLSNAASAFSTAAVDL